MKTLDEIKELQKQRKRLTQRSIKIIECINTIDNLILDLRQARRRAMRKRHGKH